MKLAGQRSSSMMLYESASVGGSGMQDDYKSFDDLQLYDSVIENVLIDHKHRTLKFVLLKVISRVDRKANFTYKVRRGELLFSGVLFTNFSYGLEWGEWSEFYRSAILDSSTLIERYKPKSRGKINHIYLGIDNGNEYREIDIVCQHYALSLEDEEFILHDDFEWLYEDET